MKPRMRMQTESGSLMHEGGDDSRKCLYVTKELEECRQTACGISKFVNHSGEARSRVALYQDSLEPTAG
jgi:hypothetical protein